MKPQVKMKYIFETNYISSVGGVFPHDNELLPIVAMKGVLQIMTLWTVFCLKELLETLTEAFCLG